MTNEQLRDVEHMKEVVGSFIESGWEASLYAVPFTLAGFIRDSWSAWWLRADFATCLYAAHVVIVDLPNAKPNSTSPAFDECDVATWKGRAAEIVQHKLNQMASWDKSWSAMRKIRRLTGVGVDLANANSFKLNLYDFMSYRPEYEPRLRRNSGCEVGII